MGGGQLLVRGFNVDAVKRCGQKTYPNWMPSNKEGSPHQMSRHSFQLSFEIYPLVGRFIKMYSLIMYSSINLAIEARKEKRKDLGRSPGLAWIGRWIVARCHWCSSFCGRSGFVTLSVALAWTTVRAWTMTSASTYHSWIVLGKGKGVSCAYGF